MLTLHFLNLLDRFILPVTVVEDLALIVAFPPPSSCIFHHIYITNFGSINVS